MRDSPQITLKTKNNDPLDMEEDEGFKFLSANNIHIPTRLNKLRRGPGRPPKINRDKFRESIINGQATAAGRSFGQLSLQ